MIAAIRHKTNTALSVKKQGGAALVIAMLILSLVIVFSASMMVEYNFSVRRITNQITSQQAYNYLIATEAIAHKALLVDLKLDTDAGVAVDNLDEIWAQEVPPFILEEGAYGGRLYDLQGRFNLNSLQYVVEPRSGEMRPAIPYTIEQGIFIRLLQAMSDDDFMIDEYLAIAITESVVDWLDKDRDPNGFNCGEDDAYYNIEGRQSHRTSNLPFASVSELQLICNIPTELYRRLLPHVTVWPASGISTININTATPALLRSLFVSESDAVTLKTLDGRKNYRPPSPLDESDIKALLDRQCVGGYNKLDVAEADLGGLKFWPNAPLGLYSNYFLLSSIAIMGDLTQTMSSVISRDNGTIAYISRSTGGLNEPQLKACE